MILRRLGNAIREQNWFTVVLEVAIVVAGIFIGLRVDDWNQGRLEQESDQRALVLFVEELELMLSEASIDRSIVSSSLEDLSLGTEIALNCDASDDERRRLVTAIANTLNWRVLEIRPSGLADIGNSGTLARLGNPDLSRAVGSINQSIRAMDDSMDLITPQYNRAWQMLLPYLLLTNPITLENIDIMAERSPASEYLSLLPQDGLCRNQEFLLGLAMLLAFYESIAYNFEAWHRVLNEAHELATGEIQ